MAKEETGEDKREFEVNLENLNWPVDQGGSFKKEAFTSSPPTFFETEKLQVRRAATKHTEAQKEDSKTNLRAPYRHCRLKAN